MKHATTRAIPMGHCRRRAMSDAAIAPAAAGYRVQQLDHTDGGFWLLTAGCYRIGRAVGAHLHLVHASVSRLHAEIEVLDGGGLVLTDLNSTNGTWLGARRVTRVALCGDFDLRVGALVLEFCAFDSAITCSISE
jgi:hypothetical protein